MKVAIATPAPAGTTRGNRRTASRYAALLRELGHTVRIVQSWTRGDHDLLIALHAVKSSASIAAFARANPERPIVLVLTGTDVHGVGSGSKELMESLRRATRIVTLQSETRRELDRTWRAKTVSIEQSAESIDRPRRARRRRTEFSVVSLGHLRAEKDPFLLADAVAMLPSTSRVRAVQVGEALTAGFACTARTRAGERWKWIGPRSHARALELLAQADVFVQTSRVEGGSLALSEAIVCGVPVLATRIPAAIGMLGARHPGLFAVGDARALAQRLERIEQDADYRDRLVRASRALAPRYARAREREAWRELLAGIDRHSPARTARSRADSTRSRADNTRSRSRNAR